MAASFIGWCLVTSTAEPVARVDADQQRQGSEHGGYFGAAQSLLGVAAAQQIPARHSHDECRSGYESRRYGVDELVEGERRQRDVPERGHLVASHVDVELRADRILHPCVGDENPQSREIDADCHEPCRGEVKRFDTLPQPKSITPTNVASMKNAMIPSMASGAPNMSPTK